MIPDKETLELILFTVNEKIAKTEKILDEGVNYKHLISLSDYRAQLKAFKEIQTILTQMIESCQLNEKTH